jgi:hypothetical protein
MSNLTLTDEENDDITVRLLSILIKKQFDENLKEALLKGLTGIDYIEQEARLMKLYNENFHKHK